MDKLTNDQLDAAWKVVQAKQDRGESDISLTDTFSILYAAHKAEGCELTPTVRCLTPAEVQQAALEILREHVPHLLPDGVRATRDAKSVEGQGHISDDVAVAELAVGMLRMLDARREEGVVFAGSYVEDELRRAVAFLADQKFPPGPPMRKL